MPHTRADPLFLDLQASLAGHYSLERELGRGGMGIVYLARDVRLDRRVAIKLLPPHLAGNAEFRRRFLDEARMAARLAHPNIVTIHAVEDTGPFACFVLAYVEGETLAQRVEREGPLSVPVTLRILREVAWALGHAHTHGIVHRDIKPENILLEAGSGRALVADFGIAGAIETSDGEPSGHGMGTVQYMSPEQAAGDHVDGRSDLYSLGLLAHYMLTGRPPFQGTAAEVMAQHLTYCWGHIPSRS
jgi:serine/threonine-protein kinase